MAERKRDVVEQRRRSGDEGAAVLEFALIGILLFTLLFGIIHFGLILSFKQDMTRAAAEGARAGAVAFPSTDAQTDAIAATGTAVKEFGGRFSSNGCSAAGMTCAIPVVAPCVGDTSHDCVTVSLSYDYENHPLYGRLPLIEEFFPDVVVASSVARVNS